MITFFEQYDVAIPRRNKDWQVFTSTTPTSYGAPDSWRGKGAIFMSKHDVKDGIRYEQYRYGYCPELNEGVLIVEEDGYFKITKSYKG